LTSTQSKLAERKLIEARERRRDEAEGRTEDEAYRVDAQACDGSKPQLLEDAPADHRRSGASRLMRIGLVRALRFARAGAACDGQHCTCSA
jgi:hypothetical protein